MFYANTSTHAPLFLLKSDVLHIILQELLVWIHLMVLLHHLLHIWVTLPQIFQVVKYMHQELLLVEHQRLLILIDNIFPHSTYCLHVPLHQTVRVLWHSLKDNQIH